MRFFAGLVVVYALCGSSVVLAQDMGAPQQDPAAGGGMAGDPGMQPAQDPMGGQQPQPPPGYGQPPPAQDPAMQPPPEGAMLLASAEDVRYIDANVDRIFLGSTAETHPAGTFYFSDYNLILLQFGYAITDQIQIALTGVPPLIDGQPYFFDLSTKINVLRGNFRFAIQGALDLVFVELSGDYETEWFARVGGVGTICFTESCWSHASFGANLWFNDEITDTFPVLLNFGIVGRLSDLVAFMAEPLFVAAIGGTSDIFDGFLFNYGVRLSGSRWGLDIGFAKLVPLEDDIDDPFILGYPLVSFTYRTEGDVAGSSSASMPIGNTASDMARRAFVPF